MNEVTRIINAIQQGNGQAFKASDCWFTTSRDLWFFFENPVDMKKRRCYSKNAVEGAGSARGTHHCEQVGIAPGNRGGNSNSDSRLEGKPWATHIVRSDCFMSILSI